MVQQHQSELPAEAWASGLPNLPLRSHPHPQMQGPGGGMQPRAQQQLHLPHQVGSSTTTTTTSSLSYQQQHQQLQHLHQQQMQQVHQQGSSMSMSLSMSSIQMQQHQMQHQVEHPHHRGRYYDGPGAEMECGGQNIGGSCGNSQKEEQDHHEEEQLPYDEVMNNNTQHNCSLSSLAQHEAAHSMMDHRQAVEARRMQFSSRKQHYQQLPLTSDRQHQHLLALASQRGGGGGGGAPQHLQLHQPSLSSGSATPTELSDARGLNSTPQHQVGLLTSSAASNKVPAHATKKMTIAMQHAIMQPGGVGAPPTAAGGGAGTLGGPPTPVGGPPPSSRSSRAELSQQHRAAQAQQHQQDRALRALAASGQWHHAQAGVQGPRGMGIMQHPHPQHPQHLNMNNGQSGQSDPRRQNLNQNQAVPVALPRPYEQRQQQREYYKAMREHYKAVQRATATAGAGAPLQAHHHVQQARQRLHTLYRHQQQLGAAAAAAQEQLSECPVGYEHFFPPADGGPTAGPPFHHLSMEDQQMERGPEAAFLRQEQMNPMNYNLPLTAQGAGTGYRREEHEQLDRELVQLDVDLGLAAASNVIHPPTQHQHHEAASYNKEGRVSLVSSAGAPPMEQHHELVEPHHDFRRSKSKCPSPTTATGTSTPGGGTTSRTGATTTSDLLHVHDRLQAGTRTNSAEVEIMSSDLPDRSLIDDYVDDPRKRVYARETFLQIRESLLQMRRYRTNAPEQYDSTSHLTCSPPPGITIFPGDETSDRPHRRTSQVAATVKCPLGGVSGAAGVVAQQQQVVHVSRKPGRLDVTAETKDGSDISDGGWSEGFNEPPPALGVSVSPTRQVLQRPPVGGTDRISSSLCSPPGPSQRTASSGGEENEGYYGERLFSKAGNWARFKKGTENYTTMMTWMREEDPVGNCTNLTDHGGPSTSSSSTNGGGDGGGGPAPRSNTGAPPPPALGVGGGSGSGVPTGSSASGGGGGAAPGGAGGGGPPGGGSNGNQNHNQSSGGGAGGSSSAGAGGGGGTSAAGSSQTAGGGGGPPPGQQGGGSSITPQNPHPQYSNVYNIYQDNVEDAFEELKNLDFDPYIGIESFFPGLVLRPTIPVDSFLEHHYATLRSNVDCTNLIQLDLTIRRSKDENGNKIDPLYKTFRFHFQYNLHNELYSVDAMRKLVEAGSFQNPTMQSKRVCVDSKKFAELFHTSGLVLTEEVTWIPIYGLMLPFDAKIESLPDYRDRVAKDINPAQIFRGLYDLAHVLQVLKGHVPLPETVEEFYRELDTFFPKRCIANFHDFTSLFFSRSNEESIAALKKYEQGVRDGKFLDLSEYDGKPTSLKIVFPKIAPLFPTSQGMGVGGVVPSGRNSEVVTAAGGALQHGFGAKKVPH